MAREFLTRHPLVRWLVPAGVVGAIAAVAVGAFSAQASVNLPDRTAAQLLADVESARVDGLSGTVVQKAALGLPELPNVGSASPTGDSLLGLLSGSHTARVWYAGETKQRLALLDSVGETDVFRNGSDVWTWNSSSKTATHSTLPAMPAGKPAPPVSGTPLTPDQVATKALQVLSPTTLVTTDSARKVAGRDAYELVLTPRDIASRIGSVRIAIDGATKVPLGVQVYARTDPDKAALDVSFTDINFAVPDDSNFAWSPPKGAIVAPEQTVPDASGALADAEAGLPTPIGTGWTTVLATHAKLPVGSSGAQLSPVFTPVSGTWGTGRLFNSKLVTILFTDDGRAFGGAVDPSALYAAAGTYK